MRLTAFQRLVLKNMLELQQREPSYRRALQRMVPLWILYLALGLAAWYVIRKWLNGNGLEYLALGMMLGAIVAQFGAVRGFIQNWAIQKKVVDAGAIERLLAEDEAEKASGEPSPARKSASFGWRAALALGVAIVLLPLGIDHAMKDYFDPTKSTAGQQVKIYTTAWCGACRLVRAHLESQGVPFQDFDVEKSVAAHYSWSATRSRGVPVAVIDNNVVRGANLGKLDEALRAAGFKLPETGPAPAFSGEAPMSTLGR
jgi:glutaredoxin